jgi:2-polyprenyl-6-methoxyphenol hydroxylase-like FAD-dependent oxidoreductase
MTETEVLIVGGGPVGLSLACELGWRGVRCLVVDEKPEFGEDPVAKINLVNARSMEFCRRWGIEKEVRHGGFPDDFPMSVLFATSMRGKLIARIPYPSMGEQQAHPASPTNRQRIPQGLFDPLMRRAAQRFESVDAWFESRTEAFSQNESCVEAQISRKDGRREKVRAKYLVGADGARSMVRETLGLRLTGEGTLNVSCGIYFRCPRLWHLHDKGKAIMSILVDQEGMWANLNAIDGYSTWRLSVYREVAAQEAPALLRKAIGGDFEFEIRAVNPWVRRAVVAERLGKGRCFLIGDAAHQLSPTGGFGMNTGMGDAVDLGWKLEAVLRGWGGDALLESYDAERRPIGERAVREATVNFRNLKNLPTYSWIEDDGAEADEKRAELGARFVHNTRAEWDSWGVQFGYRYDPSPICVPDGTPAPPDDPMVYTPSARPGSRAPHAWLAPGKSTLDLFGRGFTLLDFGAGEVLDAPFPLHHVRVDDAEAAKLYGAKLVLVRPDGHVAWRGENAPSPAVLARVIGKSD